MSKKTDKKYQRFKNLIEAYQTTDTQYSQNKNEQEKYEDRLWVVSLRNEIRKELKKLKKKGL